MHCSKTWINLHRFLDFAHTRILPKTCPTLSWDQALLSLSGVNRFQAGKQATRYLRQIDKNASNTKSCTNRENNERNEEGKHPLIVFGTFPFSLLCTCAVIKRRLGASSASIGWLKEAMELWYLLVSYILDLTLRTCAKRTFWHWEGYWFDFLFNSFSLYLF